MKFPVKHVVACALLALGAAAANAQIVIKFSHVVAQDTPKGSRSGLSWCAGSASST